ncbi:hypothetical protein J2Z40_003544 [Cytobacillus eiseniae]|uniref:DUF3953 domain-containing protein n=1 Tax=Cytobacillus eiseniae TaxID=762947 RepID=A0ABS4RJ86_9BACI|nr:DUF3953 domain-containing protein [Cytobacillus eiseniae]MBP2242962.1 hypothetical protein [Cytobacillus eiseniae]
MLKILRYVFAVITFLLASYGFFTKDFTFGEYMIFFMSLTMLVMGVESFKKGERGMGSFLIAVFLFSLYVSIEGFLLG